MLASVIFYMFAAVLLISGGLAVTVRNPVHAVLFLILCFFNASGLFLMMGAEFLAFILLIVYVGAVAVLFLFVVMMLDIDFAELRAGFVRNAPLGALIAIILACELVLGIGAQTAGGIKLGKPDGSNAPVLGASNIEAIGALLYGRYLFLFEAAGIILLVAMVGAIVLTHRQRGGVRGQNVSRQVARRPEEATVNMQPEVGKGVQL